jgi:hypothetical protein
VKPMSRFYIDIHRLECMTLKILVGMKASIFNALGFGSLCLDVH